MKQRAFQLVSKAEEGDKLSRAFDLTIMILIVLSIVTIILQSFEEIALRWGGLFRGVEIVTVVVFSLEYVLRVWTADLLYPEEKHPRLKYMTSFMALIDLIAILPYYIPHFRADLRYLRGFRLFRLLRVFKLGRYIDALQTIIRVIKESASQLLMSVMLCLFVMLFSAIAMYTFENPVQPELFPNVMASLWWAICTLTTVGYGDVYPITAAGRLFAGIISVVGIGIIAIPTGIIAAGFNRVIDQKAEAETGDHKHYCPYCGHKLDD